MSAIEKVVSGFCTQFCGKCMCWTGKSTTVCSNCRTVVQAEVPKRGTERIKDKERQPTNTFASAEKLLRVCSVCGLYFFYGSGDKQHAHTGFVRWF